METKAVMLKRDWPGKFHRSVFEKTVDKSTGKTVEKFIKQLVFEPGIPLQLDAQEYKSVKDDINKALVEVSVDAQGIARVVMSDKEREELLLDRAEKGRELDDLLKKCVDLEKQIETLQANIQEQAGTITKQSEEISSLEEEILDLEEKLKPASEGDDNSDPLVAIGLTTEVAEILKGQGIDTVEKLAAFGAAHNGSYLDLDNIGQGRNTQIVNAMAKLSEPAK